MELTLKDVANFYCCALSTAQFRVKEIKAYFHIKRKCRILKIHLAKYEGLTLADVDMILNAL